MNVLAGLLQAMVDHPEDLSTWLVLADWLEEHDDPQRAELVRLQHSLGTTVESPARRKAEDRIVALLASGVKPCVPERNLAGIRLVLIPPGRFRMGSPLREPQRMDDEHLHEVRYTRAFWMSATLVTQREYGAVTGKNPSYFTRRRRICRGHEVERFPVDSVSWEDAMLFCRRIGRKERLEQQGLECRLPTEAEWEYACRAWLSSRLPFHLGKTLTGAQANFRGTHPYPPRQIVPDGTFLQRPVVVGSHAPNAWGLFDMHGNLDEWTLDWYDELQYHTERGSDPFGPLQGELKVIRGGSWRGQGEDCRAAVRIGELPTSRVSQIGFRIILAPLRDE